MPKAKPTSAADRPLSAQEAARILAELPAAESSLAGKLTGLTTVLLGFLLIGAVALAMAGIIPVTEHEDDLGQQRTLRLIGLFIGASAVYMVGAAVTTRAVGRAVGVSKPALAPLFATRSPLRILPFVLLGFVAGFAIVYVFLANDLPQEGLQRIVRWTLCPLVLLSHATRMARYPGGRYSYWSAAIISTVALPLALFGPFGGTLAMALAPLGLIATGTLLYKLS